MMTDFLNALVLFSTFGLLCVPATLRRSFAKLLPFHQEWRAVACYSIRVNLVVEGKERFPLSWSSLNLSQNLYTCSYDWDFLVILVLLLMTTKLFLQFRLDLCGKIFSTSSLALRDLCCNWNRILNFKLFNIPPPELNFFFLNTLPMVKMDLSLVMGVMEFSTSQKIRNSCSIGKKPQHGFFPFLQWRRLLSSNGTAIRRAIFNQSLVLHHPAP